MSLICPAGHVIFKPDIVAGVSIGGQCMAKPGDCEGLTHTLITEKNRCFWRNHCELNWARDVPLTMTGTLNCLAQYPSYVSVKNYQCVPQGETGFSELYTIVVKRNASICKL